MNLVTLIGRLTADPDLRFINTGTAISKFTVAIDRSYRKDNQAVTDFIPVEIWGKKAEYCATYIEKGCLVAVSGSLHIDRYTDSEGNNRSFAKVVANSIMKLNSPNKSANIENSDTSVNGDGSFGSEVANSSANLTEYADDDLPF
ncbi:single-stranded DNA-binding protein [Intestinibacter sp.]